MASRRAVIAALVLVQLIALGGSAQQSSAEFGRASAGEIVLRPKSSAPLSGSLELLLPAGGSPGYGVTAGGTLIQDRLWFFASASHQELSSSRFSNLALPENVTSSAAGGKVDGQLGGAHDFSAFFEAARRPQLSTSDSSSFGGAPASFGAAVPSSFLSLRYTGVVSSNTFFSASFARSSRTGQDIFR
jgi:hypothetical protein